MQAIILAAGESSRLYPYNQFHKSLINVLGKTIIEHMLFSISSTNIKEVIIVVRNKDPFENILGDGSSYGLKIKYVIQTASLGMGNALLCAEKFITGDFFLMHASHIDFSDFKTLLEEKMENGCLGVLLGKEEASVGKYGISVLNGDKVIEVIEKPDYEFKMPNARIIGIYLLTKKFLDCLKNTPHGHYNFEAALSLYVKENVVKMLITKKEVISLKYPWDILDLKNYLLINFKKTISKSAEVSQEAKIIGDVAIGDNTKILEGAYIKGPCFIGKNVVIGNNSLIRNGTDIENGCRIGAYSEIKNSLIMENTTTHAGFIGDSIIGKNCKIGTGFNTANVKIDRQGITAVVNEKKIKTNRRSLGVVMGSNNRIGIRVSTMPGIIIGNDVVIGPSTTVFENIADNVIYYAEFKSNIKKHIPLKITDKKQSTIFGPGKVKPKLVLFDIDYTLFNTKEFKESGLLKYLLYNEVGDVLSKLKEFTELGIISEGEVVFQKNKLNSTGIIGKFNEEYIHIVKDKDKALGNILTKYKNYSLFLVDDKLTILQSAKRILPSIYTIWVKRGLYADNQKSLKDFVPDIQVKDLKDLVKIMGYEK